jgi:hypothetical protein
MDGRVLPAARSGVEDGSGDILIMDMSSILDSLPGSFQ